MFGAWPMGTAKKTKGATFLSPRATRVHVSALATQMRGVASGDPGEGCCAIGC
jgi:hypothetical protein